MPKITVGATQFADAISKEITKLLESKERRINELVDKYSELIIKEIQVTAPRSNINKRGKPLADSFVFIKTKLFDSVESTIYSKGASSYAHHVEFGTVDKAPRPFLRAAFDKYDPQFQREVIKILKDGVV